MSTLSAQNVVNKSPLKILIVEDDLVFNVFYKNYLANQGALVHTCLSLADAQNIINTQSLQFDAVILDNQLTDGEGISLLPQLQHKQPIAAIIMVSGNDAAESFIAAFTAGIHDYMIKPVNLDLLWLKITKAVEQQRLKRLTQLQHADLSYWVEQEQEQQKLAKHLFDNMFHDLNQPSAAVHAWVKPHSVFSGDAIMRCQADDGSWYFMLADAMGHGLAPAISLMPLLSDFHAMAKKAIPLSNIIYDLNDSLNRLLPDDRFIAAVLLRFDPNKGVLAVWNGGMPAVQLLNSAGVNIANAASQHMALGVLAKDQVSVQLQQFSLAQHGITYFMIFSDGLTETVLANDLQLQSDMLPGLIQWQSDTPFSLIQSQFKAVPEQDDVSLCLVNCHALASSHAITPVRDEHVSGSFDISVTLRGQSLVSADIGELAINFLKSQHLSIVFTQRVFTVLTELYLNALEHGVLALKSELKMQPDGFVAYYEEKQQRMEKLNERDFITLNMQYRANTEQLQLVITDSGKGFTCNTCTDSDDGDFHGRGLNLIKQFSTHFEIIAPGNSIRLAMSPVQTNLN